MTCSNFLHRDTDFLHRLRQFNEDSQRVESQRKALADELATATQHDPELVQRLHAQILASHAVAAAPALVPTTVGPVDDFLLGPLDEDLAVEALPQVPRRADELSPLFGATAASLAAMPFLDLTPLDDIPELASMSAAALPLPAVVGDAFSWADSMSSFDAAMAAGSAPSTQSSSSPLSCSPFFSPLDLGAQSAWTSPSFSPRSFSTFPQAKYDGDSLALIPPAFPASVIDEQLFASTGSAPWSSASLDIDVVPLARKLSQAGKSRTRGASEAPRFDPVGREHNRQASTVSTASSDLLVSPLLKPLTRANSTTVRKRTARTINEDPALVAVKNSEHVFAVHTQGGRKSDEGLTRLYIDESSLSPVSPIGRAVFGDEGYTPAHLAEDCTLGSVYSFYTPARVPWTVSFTLTGAAAFPAAPVSSEVHQPLHTFFHFLPGDLVVSPSHPLGSRDWWRMQECRAAHPGYPGDGHWTARFDDDGQAEKRRPARIFNHFAKCWAAQGAFSAEDGGEWSLMKLAKLTKAVK
ncbi:hypothetical protein Rhopal_001531-T1 [Rhodotorula paludigena]|uniref:Proteophosphoglycan ppg4 n=1 Tax=Rhodotorula paludigena TaxID=86838 RepID=A0AAV5G7T5_9BASI|nr:hypothetical protein Rhopal_001531-T1 [Rhodotorula paludigena]